MRRQFHLLLPAIALSAPAWGQAAQTSAGLEAATAPGDTPGDTPGNTIVVTADRTAEPLSRVGQAVTVIDTAEITRRQSATVIDLLRTTPGVEIARNGGPGEVASVFIRGAESDQTVTLIDGIKINDPAAPGGGFDFGGLLTGNIARIEVLRGAQSVLWGSQAIGGVVNLITRQPTAQLAVNARAEGGWHGTGQGFANASDKIGPVSASVGGGYYRTDGVSAYDAGTERDGYRDAAANASVNVVLAQGISADLRGFYSRGRTDVDGYAPPDYLFGDTRERDRSRQWTGYAGLNAALFDGRLRNRFGYARTAIRRRDIDPDSTPEETFRSDGRNARFEYQGVLDLGPALQSTFGAERETTRLHTEGFGAVTRGRARTTSGYGQIVATPLAGLTLTGGVRYDHHSIFGGKTTFSGSGVYTPDNGGTTFRASYSEGFKAPTLYQLQSEYGNAALRPERSGGWDAGVTQRALDGAIEAGATWFHRRSTDLIAFVSLDAPPYGIYENVARTVAEGAEVTLLLKPVDAFTIGASYTYLHAENRAPGSADFGNRLARRPANSISVNADYRWPFGLQTGATLTHASGSYDDAANSRRLEGYVLADLRADLPVGQHLAVFGRVENLFDEHYETAYQYGQPGRAVHAGVRLTY